METMNFVKDYLLNKNLISLKQLNLCYKNEPDLFMTFCNENGDPVKVGFHTEAFYNYKMQFYNQSDEALNAQLQDIKKWTENAASKPPKYDLRVGIQVLLWLYKFHCVLEELTDVIQVLELGRAMGVQYMSMTVYFMGVSLKGFKLLPVMALHENYICHYHSAIRPGRSPYNIRVGWHLLVKNYPPETYYKVDLGDSQELPLNELNAFDSDGMMLLNHHKSSSKRSSYKHFSGPTYIVSRPGPAGIGLSESAVSFSDFLKHILDLTESGTELHKVIKQGADWENAADNHNDASHEDVDVFDGTKHDFYVNMDDEEISFEQMIAVKEDDTEIIMARGKFSLRLQILSNDKEAIKNAWESLGSKRFTVKCRFNQNKVPCILSYLGISQPCFTVTTCNMFLLMKFLKYFRTGSRCGGYALEIVHPPSDILGRLTGAVKVMCLDPLYRIFYVVKPDRDSMLGLMEKLVDESVTPPLRPSQELHMVEVPDFFCEDYYLMGGDPFPKVFNDKKADGIRRHLEKPSSGTKQGVAHQVFGTWGGKLLAGSVIFGAALWCYKAIQKSD